MTRRPLHRPTQERVAAHLAGVTKTTFMQVAKVALGFETRPLTSQRQFKRTASAARAC